MSTVFTAVITDKVVLAPGDNFDILDPKGKKKQSVSAKARAQE